MELDHFPNLKATLGGKGGDLDVDCGIIKYMMQREIHRGKEEIVYQ